MRAALKKEITMTTVTVNVPVAVVPPRGAALAREVLAIYADEDEDEGVVAQVRANRPASAPPSSASGRCPASRGCAVPA